MIKIKNLSTDFWTRFGSALILACGSVLGLTVVNISNHLNNADLINMGWGILLSLPFAWAWIKRENIIDFGVVRFSSDFNKLKAIFEKGKYKSRIRNKFEVIAEPRMLMFIFDKYLPTKGIISKYFKQLKKLESFNSTAFRSHWEHILKVKDYNDLDIDELSEVIFHMFGKYKGPADAEFVKFVYSNKDSIVLLDSANSKLDIGEFSEMLAKFKEAKDALDAVAEAKAEVERKEKEEEAKLKKEKAVQAQRDHIKKVNNSVLLVGHGNINSVDFLLKEQHFHELELQLPSFFHILTQRVEHTERFTPDYLSTLDTNNSYSDKMKPLFTFIPLKNQSIFDKEEILSLVACLVKVFDKTKNNDTLSLVLEFTEKLVNRIDENGSDKLKVNISDYISKQNKKLKPLLDKFESLDIGKRKNIEDFKAGSLYVFDIYVRGAYGKHGSREDWIKKAFDENFSEFASSVIKRINDEKGVKNPLIQYSKLRDAVDFSEANVQNLLVNLSDVYLGAFDDKIIKEVQKILTVIIARANSTNYKLLKTLDGVMTNSSWQKGESFLIKCHNQIRNTVHNSKHAKAEQK